MSVLLWAVVFMATVVVHEVCHGLAAYALGDPTAYRAGRLSLNPIKHIDLFWTILFPAVLFFSTGGSLAFGMAKPVPVNFGLLGNPRRDMIWVALAGPAANFALAWILAGVWKVFQVPFFLYAVYLNLGIAFFNLVPIPPLDGSRILAGIMPSSWARRYLAIEPAGFAIVFLLYLGGFLFYFIVPGVDGVCRLLEVVPLTEFFHLSP